MPFNGNGTFARLYSWAVDAAANVNISSSRMDAEMTGIAAGLSNCLTRDGQSPPTADLPFGGKRLMNIAAAAAGTDALNRDTADARYVQANAASTTLTGNLTVNGALGGAGVTAFAAYSANGQTLVSSGIQPVGYSHSRTGQVGYHLYNGGGACEWIAYQPAHATGDDFRIGILIAGTITDAFKIAIGGAVTIPGSLTVAGAAFCISPPNGDNSTRVATTAYVTSAIAAISFSSYAPLASPAFTGTPTAPTATAGVATTQLATTAFADRLRDVPQNFQGTGSYTLTLADRGGTVDFNGTSLTCAIPANSSVAFPIGTVIVVSNFNSTNLTITCGDTLTISGTTTTGTRTLGQNGEARLRKTGPTAWFISGSALS